MPEPSLFDQEQITQLRSLIAQDADWDGYQMGTVRSAVAALLSAYSHWRETARQYNAAVNTLADENNRVGDALQAIRDHVTSRNEKLLEHRDTVDREGGHEVARGFERAASELRAVLPLLPVRPQPDLTSVSGIVNAAPDDQQVTVTGYIHHIEPRANQAGAPYAEVVLADESAGNEDSDPATVKVVVPAPVYFRCDNRVLREGMLVEFAGRAVRDVVVIASGVRPVEAALPAEGSQP